MKLFPDRINFINMCSKGRICMLEKMIDILKKNPRRIVFPEGTDARIQSAASRLKKDGYLTPVLIGNPDQVKAAAAKNGADISGIEIVDIATFPEFEKMVSTMVELRHGKMDEATCRANLQKSNYFGTMYVKMGYADALLGGATYSTADTVRPALQLVKCKPGHKIVTSCFLLVRPAKDGGEEMYAIGDCAINIDPTDDELVEIAQGTAETARTFGMEPRVAMLSYSSKGSGKGDSVDKVRSATEKLLATNPDFPADGELQFDCAFVPEVAALKAPDSAVAGKANVFIVPDINAGNIAYKMAQRFGGFEAIGPIMAGLNAPINDLSRGCNAEEVYKMAIITAALK